MCEPVSIAAGIAIVAGAAITAYGQRRQGQIAEAVGEYNKGVAETNAEIARRNADYVTEKGKIDAQRQETLTQGAVARARAAAAARGVVATQDSALNVQEDIGAAGAQDEETIRRNARREALGFQSQAADFTSRGQLASFEGRAANEGSKLAAAGTLISSVGGVASKWYQRAA